MTVHYRGTFPDGREFDSSHSRGQPTSFPLNRVIPCWTEAVQLMRPGGKARITCPPHLAYGERGAGGVIPPNATLHLRDRADLHRLVNAARMPMLTLYYAPATCALAAHLALEYAGAPYEAKRLDFKAQQQRSPEYLQPQPQGARAGAGHRRAAC